VVIVTLKGFLRGIVVNDVTYFMEALIYGKYNILNEKNLHPTTIHNFAKKRIKTCSFYSLQNQTESI
jgi:hypothetical protein